MRLSSKTACAWAVVWLGLTAPAAALGADYELAPVTIEQSGSTATVSGTVVPYKEVMLSAQIPGEVTFLAGHEGETFTAGQPLVAIDDTAIRAKREAAVASAMSAEAMLRDANVQYSREMWAPRTGKPTGMGLPSMMDQFMNPMTGANAGPTNPWVERSADLYSRARSVDEAKSQLMGARAQIQEIDTKIRDAQLSAPFDGVIAQRLVEIGTQVQPGQPLMKFSYVGFLRIQSEVPVRLVSSLSKGMIVPAHIDVGGGIEVSARVAQIFPVADEQRHTITVKFDLQKGVPGGPGMYAEVQLPDPAAQAFRLTSVPAAAVFQKGSLPAVIAVKDGKTSLRLVRVGGPVGNGRLGVLSGLDDVEKVVVASPSTLATMPVGVALP
ncbi:MAG: efflux RND transporter periplasmic adaptor subunit [Rhodomicrobium sp.]